MKKLLLFSTLILVLYSCETDEKKTNSSKEVVMSFMSNLAFDNYDLMLSTYPTIRDVNTYWKLKDFGVTSAVLNNNIVTVIGKSQDKEVLFVVEKINGKYLITKSKGLSSYFNSNLYNYCKKIGCIGLNNYDADISSICKDKEFEFNKLVRYIKETIEKDVVMENHTITKSYGFISGDITFKNYSRFTVPGYSYNLYVNYYDSQGNTLFNSKETSNYESIPFSQSKTINIFETNSSTFKKVGIKLNVINSEFIEKIIAEYAEGNNCIYSNNL